MLDSRQLHSAYQTARYIFEQGFNTIAEWDKAHPDSAALRDSSDPEYDKAVDQIASDFPESYR